MRLRTVPDLEGTFIVVNGDVLTTLDYRELVEYHEQQDAALTVAMRNKRVNIDLGVIEAEDGLVRNYIEKPSLNYQVSMGVYVYDQRALACLPDGVCQFPDLVLRLLEAGERVAAYQSEADWWDIGTVGEYERCLRRRGALPREVRIGPVAASHRARTAAGPGGAGARRRGRDAPSGGGSQRTLTGT